MNSLSIQTKKWLSIDNQKDRHHWLKQTRQIKKSA